MVAICDLVFFGTVLLSFPLYYYLYCIAAGTLIIMAG